MPMFLERQNFTDEQMQRESGGRQFDRAGRPLVGRYRDGRTPPPEQQAFGAGQMQIGTARETARRHNIPFDEQRFLTDREYNLQLADRHMGDLTRRYNGDRQLALAAYHSGTGNVDRAIRQHGRQNFAQGLGPEGRAYVASQSGGTGHRASQVPDAGPGGTLPPRRDVSTERPTAAEAGQMTQGNRFGVADPFAIEPEIAEGQQRVESRAGTFDELVTGAIEQLNQIQPQREAALRTAVDVKTAVNQEMQQETRGLIERVRPIFQQREAIAARRRELANMNPLERALRGTFDPNYNDTDLSARDRAIAAELETLGSDHQYLTGLQDQLTRLVDADYNNQNSILELQTQNITQDVQLMAQSVGAAQTILSAGIQGMENQMGIMRAQQTARADTLSQMTVAQVNVALEQAQASERGYAVINGVPLSMQELRARQQGFQEQEDNLNARHMALEGGRMDLAQRYEERLIGHMSPTEIEQAIRDGGRYQGQQLDVGRLTTAYGAIRQRQAQQVEDVAVNSAPGVARNLILTVRNAYVGTTQRMEAMFGTLPDEQRQALAGMATEMQAYREGQDAANAQGVGARYAAENLPRIQALLTRQDQIITSVANRWAGTNEDLRPVANAWLRGAPLSGEAATRGLISMARSGMPAGTNLSGPAADAFRLVQRIVAEADRPQSQAGLTPEQMLAQGNQARPNQEQRDRELIQRVQGALSGAYNNRLMDEVMRATPSLARRVAVNGQPHPFSRVNPEDFANATAYGDQEGYSRIGRELSLSPEQTQRMFAQGPNGALWTQVRNAHPGWTNDNFTQFSGRLVALQTQLMMQALDSSPSARPGFRPSAAYVSLMNNSQYQGLVGQAAQAQGRGSFGDYITSTVAGPGFMDSFRRHAIGTQQALATVGRARIEEQQRQVTSVIDSNPWRRTSYALSATPGITPNEVEALVTAIRPQIQDDDPQSQYAQIGSIIQNGHFQDRALERIRQRAAQHWVEANRALDSLRAQMEAGGL